jgi:putative phosphoesterase
MIGRRRGIVYNSKERNSTLIGLLSDTHDNLDMIRRAVGLFNDMGCDLVIHAGDFVAPFAAAELRNLRCPARGVFGNCDGERAGLSRTFQGLGEIREAPLTFSHAGRRFLVTHMDGSVAKYLATIPCDVLVFGHTHKPLSEERDGVLVVNPGEAGGWLHGKSTAALLDPAKMAVNIIPLK